MIRLARTLCAALALILTAQTARADWASCSYGGYQPWWNIFAHRNRYMTCEEQRLQRFWHDYYDALQRYYRGLEHIDWVAYYKNHGYRINGGGCGGPGGDCGPVQFAPVHVSPGMQWAAPNAASCAPPMGPMGMGMGPMGFGGFAGGYCPGPGCPAPMAGPMGPMGPMGPGPMAGPTGPGPIMPSAYYYPGTPMPIQPAGYYGQ
jgi:hypothetical protein